MSVHEPAHPTPGESGLVRVRLDFAYDGTRFSGWAAQPGLRTVEAELSRALTLIVRAKRPVRLVVAGRTDAGVHARGAVAHADVPLDGWLRLPDGSGMTPADSALRRLNGVLPADIVVRAVGAAPDGFSARFSARSRRYSYRICDRPSSLDPLRRADTVIYRRPLDVVAMDTASRRLVGLKDFASFCKRRPGATTIRTLLRYSWERDDEGIVCATLVADAFCHSMVRSLIGVMVPVGDGRQPVDWPMRVMAVGSRDSTAVVMPAHGLSLIEVAYPPDEQVAAQARLTRARRGPATASR